MTSAATPPLAIEPAVEPDGEPDVIVVMFGVNRSLSVAYPQLQLQVLEPMRERGLRYAITWAFNEIGTLHNPRSRENGLLTEFASARLLEGLRGSFLSQAHVDQVTGALFDAARRYGDPWKDEFQSLRNHVRYLYVLRAASEQAFALAPRCRWFLFLRPDLIFSEPLDVAGLIAAHGSAGAEVAITPSWDRWRGTNDRLCLATRAAAAAYGLRYDLAADFLNTKAQPLHAESYLQWCLDQRAEISQLPIIETRAHRIRCKGSEQLVAGFDLTLPGILSAQRAVLGSATQWAKLRSLPFRSRVREAFGRLVRR